MRIGLVSLHTSPLETPGQGDAGGMNVVVREAALALEQAGHDVTIVTRASRQQAAGVEPLAPHSSVRVHALDVGAPSLDKHDLPAVLPDFAQRLKRTPGIGDADVLHAHYWLSGIAAADAASAADMPVVTTLHTVAAQKNAHLATGDRREPSVRLAAEQRLTRTTVIVAGSHSEFSGVREGYGEPLPGSRVIHPGVDTELFSPSREERPHSGFRFLVLGRVQPLKGQDLALAAFLRWRARFPELSSGASLTIAGQPTPGAEPYLASLHEQARSHPDSIRFLAQQTREEAARLLRESDVVLVPSHSETFGLVSLEAAASGTPVIAARTTGLREAVSEGESGILVDGRDPEDWATAIARLTGNAAEWNRIAERARRFAAQHSWQIHASKLTDLYREIVS